jgi:hypothetical protein
MYYEAIKTGFNPYDGDGIMHRPVEPPGGFLN